MPQSFNVSLFQYSMLKDCKHSLQSLFQKYPTEDMIILQQGNIKEFGYYQ